ncbi:M13 family metallopeptidase, partial [Francisella tularensis subsp. holarctica]|nr:M13 family metallopeptidase [Francisella tularensis subsp. holarctica]
SAEIPETEKFIIIKQLRYIIGLVNLLNDIPLNTWKIYLKYRLLNAFAPLLSENFYNLNFNFYGKNHTGLEKDKPRSEKD